MKDGCVSINLIISRIRRGGISQIPRAERARQFRSIVKSMLIFLDIQGKGIRNPGQNVNGKFYCEDLKRTRKVIWFNRPEILKKTIGFSTMTTRPFTHRSFSIIPDFQKHYRDSPALSAWPSPCEFFLFP